MASHQQRGRSMFSSTALIALLWLLPFVLCAILGNAKSQSIVETLQGFPGKLPFKLETGYVGVGEADDVQLFYYFIESQRNPKKDPLMVWISGGPGCSSLTGLLYEIGPLEFDYQNYDGGLPTLLLSPYSWTQVASIIFLDAPVGAGFSYAKTPQGYNMTDKLSAALSYEFLRKWLLNHPQFMQNAFYVGGDSYSGMIVPIIVQEIHSGNSVGHVPFINLDGYLIGNPVTDRRGDANARVDYAHRVALISDELYASLKTNCQGEYVVVDPDNIQCRKDLEAFTESTDKLDEVNILEPYCPYVWSLKSNGIKWDQALLRENPTEMFLSLSKTPNSWCRVINTYVLSYIWANDQNVRDSLHVRKGTVPSWVRCNYSMSAYAYDVISTVDYHRNLTKTGYRSLIYSGDQDLAIPYVGTLQWIRSLNMSIFSKWQPWFVEGQVAGYTIEYTKGRYYMTYATVKGAGHTAPEYKPKESFAMADRWLGHYAL